MLDNYKRDKKDHMKKYVEDALERYKIDINDITAGYAILRYATANLISTCGNASDFIEWYPCNQGFTILRQAAKGLLSYKDQTDEL
jgi:hypothetical protein